MMSFSPERNKKKHKLRDGFFPFPSSSRPSCIYYPFILFSWMVSTIRIPFLMKQDISNFTAWFWRRYAKALHLKSIAIFNHDREMMSKNTQALVKGNQSTPTWFLLSWNFSFRFIRHQVVVALTFSVKSLLLHHCSPGDLGSREVTFQMGDLAGTTNGATETDDYHCVSTHVMDKQVWNGFLKSVLGFSNSKSPRRLLCDKLMDWGCIRLTQLV